MIAFLLLAAAAPSALDAEQAFELDAQRIGQWTAFRKYADKDAVMFTPQAVWARDFLAHRKDPQKAISWHAERSFVSCDGRTAVNTGPWSKADGKRAGYFTTVWQRSEAGWRWVYDGGVPAAAAPSGPEVQRASCKPTASDAPIAAPPALTPKQARTTPEDNGRGESADRTLGWDWKVAKNGARRLRVFLWTNGRYAKVIDSTDPAP